MRPYLKIMGVLCFTASLSVAQYNPPAEIKALLDGFRSYSEFTNATANPETYGLNMITWQMSHGGFSKAMANSYKAPWDGNADLSSWTVNGIPLGMFDNNATIQEIRFLSSLYKSSTVAANKAKFKSSVQKAVDFILTSQHAAGSWPQVYPKRGNYSDMATYNDNAMVRVMTLSKDILDKKAPFDTDILDTVRIAKLKAALNKSVDYAIKAQIVNGGKPTVWCQQHDPVSYRPVGARAYELPSKSGSESVGIIAFLMNWPDQTIAVQAAVRGALAWYQKNKVSDLKWVAPNFVVTNGATMWYRFYNVNDDRYFFSDRNGEVYYDITQVSMERRTGYQWGGDYGSKLLAASTKYSPPDVNTSIFIPTTKAKPMSHLLKSYDLKGRMIR